MVSATQRVVTALRTECTKGGCRQEVDNSQREGRRQCSGGEKREEERGLREGGALHNELDAGRWFEGLINRKKMS